MPLPFFPIAYPVLHSSGAWIASTSVGGYVAGTLSSTYVGALLLGNFSLLATLASVLTALFGKIFCGAAIMGAMSGISASVGTWLVAVGLDGVAKFLGIAPAPTFLGFTRQEWIVGAAILGCVFIGALFRLTARWRVGALGDRRELMSRFLGVSRSAE